MAFKRSIDSLSDVQDQQSGLELHFAVEGLSPVKRAKSGVQYYDGCATDGSRKLRFVGFDTDSQQKIAEIADTKTPVKATNCSIKRNRNQDLEIHINQSTVIAPSPKKIDFAEFKTATVKDVTIVSVDDTADGAIVNIRAKIVAIAPARPVSTGIVQELTVADNTGSISLSLWDENIDKLVMSAAYSLNHLSVRTYHNRKVLTFGRQSSYKSIDDLKLTPAKDDDKKITSQIANAKIVGTLDFQLCYSCVNCNTNVEFRDNTFMRCSRCSVLQHKQSCKFEVCVRLLVQGDSEKIILSIFTNNLLNLLQDIGEIDISQAEEALLST